jgi:hypothetical protein
VAYATGNGSDTVFRLQLTLDFNTQAIAGGALAPAVLQTTALPPTGSDADTPLRGRRVINTGLVRWSLRGQGW